MRKRDGLYICGIWVDDVTMEKTLEHMSDFIESGSPHYIVTPNADHIVLARIDPEFDESYRHADLVIPDGMPLIWASKILGKPLMERVTGSDLLPKACEIAASKGYKVFFLGSTPQSSSKAAQILKERYNGLQVVGLYSPSFGFEKDEYENQKTIEIVKQARPDILFVALGTPKQEKWIYKHRKLLNVPISVGVGAGLDFIAGIQRRAPKWIQNLGLEWFWRLCLEPKRLWRRYARDTKFFYYLLLQILQKSKMDNGNNGNGQ